MSNLPPPEPPSPPEVPIIPPAAPPEVPLLPPEIPVPPVPEASAANGSSVDNFMQSNMGSSMPLESSNPDEKTLGILMHLSPIIGYSLTLMVGLPFLGILVPLCFWLFKKESSPYLDQHGKEVMNFTITSCIALFAAWLTMFVCIGFILVPLLMILCCILNIIGAIKASEQKLYRYPFCLRLIQ